VEDVVAGCQVIFGALMGPTVRTGDVRRAFIKLKTPRVPPITINNSAPLSKIIL
jgi:hypothetical protein